MGKTTEKDIIESFTDMENFETYLILCGFLKFCDENGVRQKAEEYVANFIKDLNGKTYDEILEIMEETFSEKSGNTIFA